MEWTNKQTFRLPEKREREKVNERICGKDKQANKLRSGRDCMLPLPLPASKERVLIEKKKRTILTHKLTSNELINKTHVANENTGQMYKWLHELNEK